MNKNFNFSIKYHQGSGQYTASCEEYSDLTHTERHPVHALMGFIELLHIVESLKVVEEINE